MLKRLVKMFGKPSYRFYANILSLCLILATSLVLKYTNELNESRKEKQNLIQEINILKEKLSATKVPANIKKPTPPKKELKVTGTSDIAWEGDADKIPLAFKNKNPLNVKSPGNANKWKGQIGVDKQGHAKFLHWEDGIRAAAMVLKNYALEHKIDTIEGLVKRFAEGNQKEYMAFLEKRLNITRKKKINLLEKLPEILKAMTRFEAACEFPAKYFVPYDVVVTLVTKS